VPFYPTQRDVAIAEYSYRHEAEFAAGFLADAGIPFRLQTDDAGGVEAFMSITRPARLWVRPEDVERACDVLEIVVEPSVSPRLPAPQRASGDLLTGRERLVAGVLGLLFLVAGLGIAPLPLSGEVAITSYVLVMVFGVAAVFGRSVAPIRLALRVLSGHVP
jgi:hypothetical protein